MRGSTHGTISQHIGQNPNTSSLLPTSPEFLISTLYLIEFVTLFFMSLNCRFAPLPIPFITITSHGTPIIHVSISPPIAMLSQCTIYVLCVVQNASLQDCSHDVSTSGPVSWCMTSRSWFHSSCNDQGVTMKIRNICTCFRCAVESHSGG